MKVVYEGMPPFFQSMSGVLIATSVLIATGVLITIKNKPLRLNSSFCVFNRKRQVANTVLFEETLYLTANAW